MRWTEAELERYLRQGPDGAITEKALQSAVVRLLRQHGYDYCYHTYNARRSPSGFPDLLACHREPGHKILALEAKTASGEVTLAQWHWLTALGHSAGVHAQVVRPADLEALVTLLRGA